MKDFPRTFAYMEALLGQEKTRGAQLWLSHDEECLLHHAWGEARAGEKITVDHSVTWLSMGKPLLALAAAKLWEEGRLDVDRPVAETITEFGGGGKEKVTTRHLLTHTSGFRHQVTLREELSYEQTLSAIYDLELEPGWILGETAGYQRATSWYVLWELIKRLCAMDPQDYLQRFLFNPLSLTTVNFYPNPSLNFQAGFFTSSQDERRWPVLNPGVSARGTCRELARIYQMLLGGGGWAGKEILKPKTVDMFTCPQRRDRFDLTFKRVVDWGLGFIVNTHTAQDRPYAFPPWMGRAAFGHGGMQSGFSACDPESGIVLVCHFNSAPGEVAHQQRMQGLYQVLQADLDAD